MDLDIKRLQTTLEQLNEYGNEGQGINRLAYTEEEQEAKNFFMELCKKEGMSVRLDTAGNIIARREGQDPSLPAVAFGSHIDTVYEGGKYDGAVGVVAALEVIRSLNDKKIKTAHPLEIISFACEESARFGYSTIGSKAMTGLLSGDYENLRDKDGVYLKEELSKYSLNLEEAKRPKEELEVFFEIHIEQGPALEETGKKIGIVTGIAAPTRFKLLVKGLASHSGTTPMKYRKDALLGASEIALALEEQAMEEEQYDTVATVGVCDVKPGAMNIVPGLVEMKVDIRGVSEESKARVIEKLQSAVEKAEAKRGLEITSTVLAEETPVQLEERVIDSLKETADKLGHSYLLMPSGAGHDAMNMAHLCPTGMLFIPSKDGLSHNPQEYSSIEDIGIGAELLEEEIMKWAKVVKEAER
ncbi:Zn-dependent hydrolase [Planococcus salinus]|uniref:Zn-dependent hydrolase n=1 Tax=Planococcus salinus TaxID=1848460 RepID=A0A3M8P7R6_9BACL|nr:Zn-dependent hydrolase [Planococcus salinus]RNF39738.1 Zn-dependent hydrolase [Planococcus salinus]